MRSKIWSKIVLFVCFCVIAKYSVVCIHFEDDDDPIGAGLLVAEGSPFGSFGDLMPPNFAEYFSTNREENPESSDDIDRYNEGKAKAHDEEDFRSYIGNVYDSNPTKNIFDVLKFDSDIDDVYNSNRQQSDDMDYDDDGDEVRRDKVKRPSMKANRRISSSWDKSSDWEDDMMIGKAASMKDSISRLIGIGHKSSTSSPAKTDTESDESKKDGDFNDDDDDDEDDDSEDDESNAKTTKTDGKSQGNIFSKLFSKSKTDSSDIDHKVSTEASSIKLTTEESFSSNSTTADDDEDDDDDDDEEESGDNSTSRISTTAKSSESDFTIDTTLSSSTTLYTSTTATTEKGKSHKHKESSTTSTTVEPDGLSSTEKVTKKQNHFRHRHPHTSTTPMPSTTLAHKSSHKHSKAASPKNTTDTGDENKSDHKSSAEIIEAFLTGLGHKTDDMKDNHTSTEAPATKSSKHPKTHKKKNKKSKHNKITSNPPESLSTELKETNFNSSSTAKPENKSTTGNAVSTTIRVKGDTTTANPTPTTDSGASFPAISITRTTSEEKFPTTDSSTAKLHAYSDSDDGSSKSTSTTEIPTLGPYVEEFDDTLSTTESIIYSDWNPDVFP